MASDQERVLRLALDLLDRRPDMVGVVSQAGFDPSPSSPPSTSPVTVPDLPLERFAAAGFATGLTAAIGAWSEAATVRLPDAWTPWIEDQRREVAARQRLFDEVLWRLLTALGDAGVPATPVKGAVLARGPWPGAEARPMADIDLMVPPSARRAARDALEAAGFRMLDQRSWEDTYLAWPGVEPLRRDGESAGHPGKVEIHPGWVERLHNYLVTDEDLVMGRARAGDLAGAPCRLLDPAGSAAQVIGHLSASVVRADVRALQVIDAVVVLRALDDDQRAELAGLWRGLDPRLSAPGLWLVGSVRPADVDPAALDDALGRLGAAARARLAAAGPASVLRQAGRRTGWGWRNAFVATSTERGHMARQFVLPAADDLPGGEHVSSAARHARRVARGVRRLLRR